MAITVTINASDQSDKVFAGAGISIHWQLGGRGTMEFSIREKPTQTYRPMVGHGVTLYDGATAIWGGSIDEYTERTISGSTTLREFLIKCVSHERFLDKRLVVPQTFGRNFFTVDTGANTLSVPGNGLANGRPVQLKTDGIMPSGLFHDYTYYVINRSGDTLQLEATLGGGPVDIITAGTGNHSLYWTAGAIVSFIISFYGASEGISAGVIMPGAMIEIKPIDRENVSAIFDDLAAASNYIWYVNPLKQLYFVPATYSPAPWDATDGSDLLADPGFSVRRTREQLSNAVYVRIAKESQAPLFLQQNGDGTKRRFRFLSPIRELVSISTTPLGEPTIGVWGVDTDKNWYYTPDDYWIVQDAAGTPLTSGETLSVTYYAPGFDVEVADDAAAQFARAAIEGGSGIYERMENHTSITSRDAGQALADALLAIYKVDTPEEISYQTRVPGIRPGMVQAITQNAYAVNDSFLVQSVTGALDVDRKLKYTVAGISTTRLRRGLDTFLQFVGGGAGGGGATVAGGGGGGGGAANITISAIALTVGAGTDTITQAVITGGLLVLKITQNATGNRRIAWSADFATNTPVDIPMVANAVVTMTFAAIGAEWTLVSGPHKPTT